MKIILQKWNEIKMFSDEGELRELVGGPALTNAKGSFLAEGKYTRGKVRSLGANEEHREKKYVGK